MEETFQGHSRSSRTGQRNDGVAGPIPPASQSSDVVVVGAGMAGLMAASHLARNGFNVILVEASCRVGGRLLQVESYPGYGPVDMGGELVEGTESILMSLIKEQGWSYHKAFFDSNDAQPEVTSGRQMLYHKGSLVYDDSPLFATSASALETAEERWASFSNEQATATPRSPSSSSEQSQGSCSDREVIVDCPLVDLLCGDKTDPGSGVVLEIVNSHLCQRDAVELAECSARMQCTGWPYGPTTSRLDGTFYLLLRHLVDDAYKLRDNLTVKLNSVVKSVAYGRAGESDRSCYVQTGDGTSIQCKATIVTVPLSILQARKIVFSPPLPEPITSSLDGLRMGSAVKIHLAFSRRWWPEDLGILYNSEGFLSQYWVDAVRTRRCCLPACDKMSTTSGTASHATGRSCTEDHAGDWTGAGLGSRPEQIHQGGTPGDSPGSALQAWRELLLPVARASSSNSCSASPVSSESVQLSDVGVVAVYRDDITGTSASSSFSSEPWQSSSGTQSMPTPSLEACDALYSLFGFSTAQWADAVCRHPPKDAVRLALAQLDSIFGNRDGNSSSPANESFMGALMCDWSSVEHVQGGYCACTVSAQQLRSELRRPVYGGRLFFAGEHTHAELSCVQSAMESGLRAAKQAMTVFD